jgi:hypothetical protein
MFVRIQMGRWNTWFVNAAESAISVREWFSTRSFLRPDEFSQGAAPADGTRHVLAYLSFDLLQMNGTDSSAHLVTIG